MKNHHDLSNIPQRFLLLLQFLGSQDPKSNPKPAQHDPVLEHALQRQVANLRCVFGSGFGVKTMANMRKSLGKPWRIMAILMGHY
jgi:hypothetical protein